MSINRVPAGVPTGGQFSASEKAEADVPLDLPGSTEGHAPHDMAHLGIHTITLPDGTVVAHNTRGHITCPVCEGDRTRAATCEHCVGRGIVSDIPFCDRAWDVVEVTENGGRIYLGGHDCQPGGGDAMPGDQFDLVVSLYTRVGYEPADGVRHLRYTMFDGDLHPEDHGPVVRLAEKVVEAARRGEKVLVRCQAGMNRSGLVAGLALVKMGWSTDDAIEHMRAERSPFVLFNESFVAFIREHEQSTPRTFGA